MSQAITNKTIIKTAKYGWLVCDYTISGNSLSYSLYFHWDGGDCQLDNCYIKYKNGSDIWRNSGRVYSYQGLDYRGSYNYPIHSGTATISGEQTIQFGITKYQNVGLSGEFTVTGGSAPANFSASNIVAKWDRITFTSTIGSPNGTLTAHAPCVSMVPLVGGAPKYENAASGTIPASMTTTITNDSTPISLPNWSIKGCGMYYVGAYAANAAGAIYGQGPAVYTPPSPPVLTHTEPSDSANGDVHIEFVGGTYEDNWSSYDTPELTRTVRYNVNGGSWIYIVNDVNALMTDITEATIPVLAGDTVVVEAWMSYYGSQSEIKTVTLANTPDAALYGSVNNLSKSLHPLYATFGNYFDGHHVLTGRESSVSTDISGEDITLTKVSSGSGTYHWVAYPIDMTDELINKQVTLTGEFKTSGNFTSGPRLWWLNSANTNILSGPVASIEYIGNSGKFSVSGTIPARPSGAGKLALLLYSNIASAAQGVYTIYRNVELKANVKNIFNYISAFNSNTSHGLTASMATDGTITYTGTLDTNSYRATNYVDITNYLDDGATYVLSKTNYTNGDKMILEVDGLKAGSSSHTYWASRTAQATFTVDKTTYQKYTVGICAKASTTSGWDESLTIASKYQLEKGDTATSFAPFVDTKTHKLKKVYGSVDGRSKLIYCEGYN